MFAGARPYNAGIPAVGDAQWKGHGTHDRKVWGGPGAGPFRHLFTEQSRAAERAAYERLHTGRVYDATAAAAADKLGSATFYSFMPSWSDPTTGRLVQPRSYDAATGLYEYIVIDSQYVGDLSSQINAAEENRRQAFVTYWVDNEVLATAASPTFIAACAAGQNGGDAKMPANLVAAECTPNIMRHFPVGSSEYSLAAAKSSYLLRTRPDGPSVGIVQTGPTNNAGMPATHNKEPRSAGSALKDAVA